MRYQLYMTSIKYLAKKRWKFFNLCHLSNTESKSLRKQSKGNLEPTSKLTLRGSPMKSNPLPWTRRQRHRQFLLKRSSHIQRLNPLKTLQESHQNIAHFIKRKQLAETNTRVTPKSDHFPSQLSVYPTIRMELFCIFSPYILSAMHHICVKANYFAFHDGDRLFSVCSAASG